MINENSRVIGVGSSITFAQFEAGLEISPALIDARPIFDSLIKYGVDPAFFLAVFGQESTWGTAGKAVANLSPGNARPPTITGAGKVIDYGEDGQFLRYNSWLAGSIDLADRWTSASYVYHKEKRTTIRQIIERASPKSDNNRTEDYIAFVVSYMNRIAGIKQMKVAISSGHHNWDGGNPTEAAITGELTEAYARAFKLAGWDVRVITPDGPDADSEPGDGQFAGGLQAAARQIVTWAASGWIPDIYLETHTEGVADPNVRGVFAIYPNMNGDIGKVVRDLLGGRVVRAISKASGIPVRGGGLMAESSTGVGLGGDRLGIFEATKSLAAKTARLIIEHGSHSSPLDLAILRTPGMFDKIARAAVQSFSEFFGVTTMPTEPEQPPVITFTETDKVIGGAFRERWMNYDSGTELPEIGFPKTNEFDITLNGKKRTVQLFERKAWIFQPEETGDWRVVSANFDDLALIVQFARLNHLI